MNKTSASVFDKDQLEEAVSGSDVVFAALSGDLPRMAQAIIDAMTTTGSTQLIFITSYGIYGELPGQDGNVASVLAPYRQAADIIEASNFDYTILRPGWFDNSADRSYELVPKGEVITKNNVSRYAIADFVKSVANNPSLHIQENLGIVRD